MGFSIISFLFSDEWMSWFDLVIVDGQKPRFFSSGTPLLRVDKKVVSIVRIRQLGNLKTTLKHYLSLIHVFFSMQIDLTVTFKISCFSVITVREMGRITISMSHHSFSRSKYFHLLIPLIEGFINLIR